MPPKKSTTKNLPGTIGIGSMGGLVRLDDVTRPQGRIIPDATSQNSGVMTKDQAAKLATLTPGGGSAFKVVNTAVAYGAAYGDFVVADSTLGSISIDLPLASDATAGQNAVLVKNEGSTGNFVTTNIHIGNGIDYGGVLWPGDFVYLISDGVSQWLVISSRLADEGARVTATKIANYAAVPGDFVVCDPTAGAFNVTLPAANLAPGAVIVVKNKADVGPPVTVLFTGGDTSDGQASIIVGAFESVRFVSDGVSDWMQSA